MSFTTVNHENCGYIHKHAQVQAALKLWDGKGSFVFTSSAGVYKEGAAEDATLPVVVEDSPVAEDSPRQQRLLAAEAAVLAAGGCVVRLVGLYHSTRCVLARQRPCCKKEKGVQRRG